MTAHKRGQAKRSRLTYFSLYHFGEPGLYLHPQDWRDNDANGSVFDPDGPREETWQYIGNILAMLPYELLAGVSWKWS
jgi:hypothetical protein